MYKNHSVVRILTFHQSLNFGAILQAYALQETIKGLGYDVKILDYNSPRKAFEYTWKFSRSKSWKRNIHDFLSVRFYRKRSKYSKNFIKHFLIMSDKCYTESNLQKVNQENVRFICGSDQVWNVYNTKADWNYFLTFVKQSKDRIAYGASIGVTEIEDPYRERFVSEVRKFAHVSVRGKQEAAVIKEYCGIDSQIVLDPTLLLEKSNWEKMESQWKHPGKYIFLYTLGWKKEALLKVKEIAAQVNLPVIVPVFDLMSYLTGIRYGFRGIIFSPQDFLAAVHHAEYVFTDAYHGIVFSTIYRKTFWVLPKKERHNTACRIEDYLEMISLSGQKMEMENQFKYQQKINFQVVEEILNREKEHSILYLKNSLCEN